MHTHTHTQSHTYLPFFETEPSSLLSLPSTQMSGILAVRSFKKSHCFSFTIQCFLEGGAKFNHTHHTQACSILSFNILNIIYNISYSRFLESNVSMEQKVSCGSNWRRAEMPSKRYLQNSYLKYIFRVSGHLHSVLFFWTSSQCLVLLDIFTVSSLSGHIISPIRMRLKPDKVNKAWPSK